MELKKGLAGLPMPRNDFEIVIPENEHEFQEKEETDQHFVEDAADVETKRLQILAEKSKSAEEEDVVLKRVGLWSEKCKIHRELQFG